MDTVLDRLLDWLIGGALARRVARQVAERTRELAAQVGRLETALRAANMHVFFQDRDLRYLSAITPQGMDAAPLVGRSDDQVLPSTERDAVLAAKRRVIATGEPGDCDVSYVTPQGRTVFAVHIEPTYGPDNAIEGVSCSAVDITRMRSLESEQRRLSDELKTAVQRYELALRDSGVLVFTQDRALTYTSISNPPRGLAVADILGRRDEIILAGDGRDAVIGLKRQCLIAGNPQQGEFAVAFAGGGVRWYELHIEPLRDVTGEIIGLLGAAIDVTRRKEDDAHLRLLMRELTHRSKNLLAVIQAMARQTARHAGSIESFVDEFDARLRALATSHDLLIEEGWHGASLDGLARLQLQPFLDAGDKVSGEKVSGDKISGEKVSGDKISIDGPTVLLKPEAAQAVGLALYELANNARQHGALSVPAGHVALTWRRVAQPQGDAVVLHWTESGGPAVAAPRVRRFGSMVIERNLERALGAKVTLAFLQAGVQCDIRIPPLHLVGAAGNARNRTAES
jgi:PAS domain S-box-containing protein